MFEWEEKFNSLSKEQITVPKNSQNRNIKQIVGHMIDSASNNTHRVVHLHYQQSSVVFPNYATYGNNDRWIAIQNYQEENWVDLIQLWKYLHLHLHYCHVINNVDYVVNSIQYAVYSLKFASLQFKDFIKFETNQ